MANKFDLKTVLTYSTADKTSYTTNVGGGVVPAGRTRFLTYIRIERTTDIQVTSLPTTQIGIGIASFETNASTITSYATLVSEGAEKLRLVLPTTTHSSNTVFDNSVNIREIKGSTEQPILSVAGGNFMILGTPLLGATATIKLQYFDE